MPRLGSVCELSVWRVPKLTSLSTVAFIRAALTGATIARSLASGDGAARRQRATDTKARPVDALRLSSWARTTGICAGAGLGARQPPKTQRGRIFMLRSIDHFIGGSTFA